MTLPNLITVFRIILIPVYLVLFFSDIEDKVFILGMIFMIAGVSDVLDGYIARRFNLMSKLGAALDPFADKMMSFTVLVTFTMIGLIPVWILIPMLVKEIIMIGGGLILYIKHGRAVIPSNKYGKVATFSLYAAILSIVFNLSMTISIILLSITVTLNLIAFYNYLKIFRKLLDDEKSSL
ncbi:CDP-diacylglycerol--glycerol-3-phosphate 3-phosphatidyltransferase [Gudongella sp. SC589]|uniref:CDP-diacylglycerol--glycerol-3-phosphate 3-phosphatidyltransferase n=1 Tax=Gudongella sp. SC589 TaxID=3385990 RepID=UPI003904AF3A